MLTIAILGCGSRGRTYAKLIASMPERYQLTAAVDPNSERRKQVRQYANNPDFQGYSNETEFFAQGRLADVLVIATQDAQHFDHASQALQANYHLLLEKPAAQTLAEIQQLRQLAIQKQRRVALCFVLRYTPFYRALKHQIEQGSIGQIMHIDASEGVGAFHQAHSFVRGHWAKSANSTPMIIAKCSHDTDLLAWLTNSPASRVSSLGELSWFTAKNKPHNAPSRCTDGCPIAPNCLYDAHQYLDKHRRWLEFIYPKNPDQDSDATILDWLKQSPWSRCVWDCDNDVVDHQALNVQFQNGATASLSMSAFDHGRQITVHGTLGTLRGGDNWDQEGQQRLQLRLHHETQARDIPLEEIKDAGYAGHGGGDYGLIDQLDQLFDPQNPQAAHIDQSLQSHLIGFAAEQSRLQNGQPIAIDIPSNSENPTTQASPATR